MFALFEEAGKFQAGRVMSEAEASAQIELDSGKRVKVKAGAVWASAACAAAARARVGTVSCLMVLFSWWLGSDRPGHARAAAGSPRLLPPESSATRRREEPRGDIFWD